MLIAGIDEVGRGCLAGPVVAACVVLKDDFTSPLIKDSKTLSRKRREEAALVIREHAVSIGLGIVCSFVIDRINILNATKQAMQLALSKTSQERGLLICDCVALKNIEGKFIHPNKADRDYIQVAAASIIAKTYRDELMDYLSTLYPSYGWERNAGYGTAKHIEAIKLNGACILHRKSFLRNILVG